MSRKELLKKSKMPIGKKAKLKLDEWINQNVNLPLAKRGYEDTGAALSAAISAGGELLIPDDLADAAMAAVPGMRILKSGKKGLKALKTADKAPTLDYKAIDKAEREAQKARRKLSEKTADTLDYSGGQITRKKPNLTDTELRELEEAGKLKKRK